MNCKYGCQFLHLWLCVIQADDSKDGNLSLDEMLNHEYVFYSTVYNESNGDYYEDYHDEL